MWLNFGVGCFSLGMSSDDGLCWISFLQWLFSCMSLFLSGDM